MGGKVKTFSLHWGSGIVEEEAQIGTEYHVPTIQLLKFTDGEATSVRLMSGWMVAENTGRFS